MSRGPASSRTGPASPQRCKATRGACNALSSDSHFAPHIEARLLLRLIPISYTEHRCNPCCYRLCPIEPNLRAALLPWLHWPWSCASHRWSNTHLSAEKIEKPPDNIQPLTERTDSSPCSLQHPAKAVPAESHWNQFHPDFFRGVGQVPPVDPLSYSAAECRWQPDTCRNFESIRNLARVPAPRTSEGLHQAPAL